MPPKRKHDEALPPEDQQAANPKIEETSNDDEQDETRNKLQKVNHDGAAEKKEDEEANVSSGGGNDDESDEAAGVRADFDWASFPALPDGDGPSALTGCSDDVPSFMDEPVDEDLAKGGLLLFDSATAAVVPWLEDLKEGTRRGQQVKYVFLVDRIGLRFVYAGEFGAHPQAGTNDFTYDNSDGSGPGLAERDEEGEVVKPVTDATTILTAAKQRFSAFCNHEH